MRESTARQKVRGGKLLSVRVRYGERIESVQLLGDFFVVPEDSLPLVEAAFSGMPAKATERELSDAARAAVARNGIELIGIDPDSIAGTIAMAMG